VRPAHAAPVLVLALLGAPAGASASWSSTAGGSAVTRAGVMTGASAVSAECTNKSPNSSIRLRWTASPEPYVTGYTVVRRSSNGSTTSLPVLGRTTTAYTDTVLLPAGQTLTYTVEATSLSTLWRTGAVPASGRPSYTAGKNNSCVTL
jgi:hypothetical protein